MYLDPDTWARIGLGAQTAGMGMQAISAFFSAASARRNMRYQAKMAKLNARSSEWAAQQELRRGQHSAALSSMKYGQIKGSQRAALAANGVDVGYGSAAEALTGTDIAKEWDTNAIIENSLRAAWGHRLAGVGYENEALMANANASQISPFMSAATSLLGNAGRVADSWYQYTRNRQNNSMPMANYGGYVYGQPSSYNEFIR